MAEIDAADSWWHSQPEADRCRWFRWLSRGSNTFDAHAPIEGQIELPI